MRCPGCNATDGISSSKFEADNPYLQMHCSNCSRTWGVQKFLDAEHEQRNPAYDDGVKNHHTKMLVAMFVRAIERVNESENREEGLTATVSKSKRIVTALSESDFTDCVAAVNTSSEVEVADRMTKRATSQKSSKQKSDE